MNKSHILTDTQAHAIRRLYALGASKQVIADAVGVTPQTVTHHCDKPGLVVPADRRERQKGVKYKPRQPKAAPAKTTSLEPVSLDDARGMLGLSGRRSQDNALPTINDSARQMVARVAPPQPRGLFARIFGT
jgi:hypothetical protein